VSNPRASFPLAVVLACVLASPGGAVTESPNVARGFQPERSFELGEIDHVSGFNGSLIVTLGIGPTYVVSPHLSYSFSLTYSSNVWDGDEGSEPETTASYPNRTSNSGLGWLFSISGRLIQPGQFGNGDNTPIYLAPDGSRSVFYEARLPGGADTDPGVLYSRDSKYVRLRRIGSCSGQCTYELDFPSGLVHRFRQSDGQLEWIMDRFGNAVFVTYSANGDTWTVTDGFRSHTVHLVSKTLDTGSSVMMVDSVDLAAFGGTTASYDFTYSATASLPRPLDTDPNTPTNASTTLLTGVTGPEGWSVSLPDYQLDTTGGAKIAGTLQEIGLPTGGSIEYDYQMYNFPNDSDSKPFLTSSVGVKTRRTVNSSGTTEGIWSYVAEQPGPGNKCGFSDPPKTLRRTTVSPLGDKTVKYFTVWPCLTLPPDPDYGEYGLPYDKTQSDQTSGAYLSEEVWNCSFNAADPRTRPAAERTRCAGST
jgi:hypothetical protein